MYSHTNYGILYEICSRHVFFCLFFTVAQSAMCLAADTCLTADPKVESSIWAGPNTFKEIDHEIISTANLLPSADSRRVVCQL